MPASPTERLRRSALVTFGAVALSLSACEGTSDIPAYGLPDVPPAADADADASRRDAALPFPGPDAKADAATKPDASDAGTDVTDASRDSSAD